MFIDKQNYLIYTMDTFKGDNMIFTLENGKMLKSEVKIEQNKGLELCKKVNLNALNNKTNSATQILKSIIKKPNNSIDLLKLLSNDYKKLNELYKILNKLETTIRKKALSNTEKNIIEKLLKTKYKEFCFFSKNILNIIELIPIEKYNIYDLFMQDEDIIELSASNSFILEMSKKYITLDK